MINAAAGVLLKVSSLAVGFIVNFWLAKILIKSDFGLYSAILSLFLLALAFANVGTNYSLISYVPKQENAGLVRDYLKDALAKAFFATVVVSLVGSLYLQFFVLKDRYTDIVVNASIFFFALLFLNYHTINVALLRSKGRFKSSLALENLIQNLLVVILMSTAYYKFDLSVLQCLLWAFIFSFFCSYLTVKQESNVYIQDYLFVNRPKRMFNSFMLLGCAEAVVMNMDVLILAALYDSQVTAEYFLAKKFIVVFGLFYLVYNIYVTPKISFCFKDTSLESRARIRQLLQSRWNVLLVTLVFSMTVLAFYEKFLNVIGLEQYLSAKTYLIYFFGFVVLNIFTGPVLSVMNVSGLERVSSKMVSMGAVVFIIATLPLVKIYGSEGIVLALILSLITWKIFGIYYIWKNLGLNMINGKFGYD